MPIRLPDCREVVRQTIRAGHIHAEVTVTTLAPWTEQWQHFTSEVREQFWGDLVQHTRQSWQDVLGRLSIEARDRYLGVREYERSPDRTDARNGFMPGKS
jgi:hypothetical protein